MWTWLRKLLSTRALHGVSTRPLMSGDLGVAGSLAEVIHRPSWRETRLAYAQREDRRVREAFALIMRRANDCDARILPHLGEGGPERYLPPVLQIARQWKRWRQPVDTWEPESTDPREQLHELICHLFAAYPVPRLFESVFLEPREYPYQEWLPHLGDGRNIRTAPGMTAPLTSRMAHFMLLAPEQLGVIQALRWGQVTALGGSAELADEVITSPLGRVLGAREDEEFWLAFLQWLVNHPELPVDQVSPVVSFVEKYRAHVAGFSMKGRSVHGLSTLMAAWDAGRKLPDCVAAKPLPASGIGADWEWWDLAGSRWVVEEIRDLRALQEEGDAMDHCVFTYADQIRKRRSSIWSLKVEREGQMERALTVEVWPRRRRVEEALGRENRSPNVEELAVLERWASETGLDLGVAT
jgi:hypothetical protein